MPAFTEQVAVVTGASSGVGAAISLRLAEEGASVCLVGRDTERLERVAAEMPDRARAHAVSADLRDEDEVGRLADEVRRAFGRLDMLVHSAGVITIGPLEDASLSDFDEQYRVNVRAPYSLTRALLPLLVEAPGQVVFINSTAGRDAKGGVAQYAATKHALKGVADSLRDEINARGVRVLSVFLGRTATPMQATLHEVEGRSYRPENLIQPRDVALTVAAALGLPRTAEITEISMRPMVSA